MLVPTIFPLSIYCRSAFNSKWNNLTISNETSYDSILMCLKLFNALFISGQPRLHAMVTKKEGFQHLLSMAVAP